MKKALICGLICVFAVATANAGMTLSWTITPDAGMDKIVGTLTSDGGVIDAIDVGTPAAPGITGTLYQDWVMGGYFTTPAADVAVGAGTQPSPAIDSHFLVELGDLTIPAGRELYEDNDLSIDGNLGWGTGLGGTFGLAPGVQDTTLDFVQLYVPCGTASSTHFMFEASEAGAPKTVFEGFVPEPGMLCLLGLGSLAMLLIRRR